MQISNVRPSHPIFRSNKFLLIGIGLAVIASLSLYAFFTLRAKTSALPAAIQAISQATLQEQYGLQVQLIAATAAGGMVDVRLKIVDPQKAQALLEDRAHYPALRAGRDSLIKASDDFVQQPIKFENGASIYSLFPNAGNLVKPGQPVTLVFGNLQLDPILAR